MTDRATLITDAILSRTTDEELKAIFDKIGSKLHAGVGTPNPENTINSIGNDEGNGQGIAITPNPDGTWVLYIPPTQREHFEFGDDPADYDPLQNDIKAPWDETDWETLEGAVLALLISVRRGEVVYNDGRVAR